MQSIANNYYLILIFQEKYKKVKKKQQQNANHNKKPFEGETTQVLYFDIARPKFITGATQ